MFDILKTCLYGLLAIVLSPFVCLFLLLYAIYGIFLFLYILIRSIVIDLRNIFNKKGEFINPFKELPEDVLCRQILERQKEELQNPQGSEVKEQVQNIIYQQNFYGTFPPNMQGNFPNPQGMPNPNNMINNQPPLPSNQQLNNQNPYPYTNYSPIEQQQFNALGNSTPGNNVINPPKNDNTLTDDLEDDKGGNAK